MRDALQVEAEACVVATEGAANIGLKRVVFESDRQTLVRALNSSSHELSQIGVLLREARSFCVGNLGVCLVAHGDPNQALGMQISAIWFPGLARIPVSHEP